MLFIFCPKNNRIDFLGHLPASLHCIVFPKEMRNLHFLRGGENLLRAETDPRSIATSLIVGRPTDVLDIRKLEKKNMSPNRSGRCSKLQKSQIPEKFQET